MSTSTLLAITGDSQVVLFRALRLVGRPSTDPIKSAIASGEDTALAPIASHAAAAHESHLISSICDGGLASIPARAVQAVAR